MVKTYNPKQVTVSIGTHIVTGFADDSFITVESLGDGISSVSGCDGEVGRSILTDSTRLRFHYCRPRTVTSSCRSSTTPIRRMAMASDRCL